MRRALAASLLGWWGVLGCAPSAARDEPRAATEPRECRTRLTPRTTPSQPVTAPSKATEPPPSLIVVHVEAPLSPWRELLDRRIPRRLASGRVNLGPVGSVDYEVTRGELSLEVEQSVLVIETPARVQVDQCRGSNCRVACDAVARAEVPLTLDAHYRFRPARVSARFPKGCKVRVLGGLVSIDLTATVEPALEPELRRVERTIDGQLPPLRAQIEQGWAQVAEQRDLPLGGCLLVRPTGLIQGPVRAVGEQLRASFALVAEPEVRKSCAGAGAPVTPALPPLRVDTRLPDAATVYVGMVTPLSELARALESSTPTDESLRVTRAQVTARGAEVDVLATLGGDVCGDVVLAATPSFGPATADHVGLRRATLAPGDRERLVAAHLDPSATTAALAALPRLAPLLSVSGFRDVVPVLAKAQSTPKLWIEAQVTSTAPAGAAARGEELIAWLEAHGSLRLESK